MLLARASLIALFLAAGCAQARAAAPVRTHNGTCANATSGTTMTCTVTAGAGDQIELCANVASTGAAIATLAASGAGLTWTPRAGAGNVSPSGWGSKVQCFGALTAGALAGVTITITSNITIGNAVGGWLTASGTNAGGAYDSSILSNVTVTYSNAGATAATAPITTAQNNDLLIVASGGTTSFQCGTTHTFGGSAADGQQTQASSGGTHSNNCLTMSWRAVTATQSATTVLATGSGASEVDWIITLDAMTADSAVISRPRLLQ